MSAEILPFSPGHSTFHPEMVLFEGRKRRQWAVVESRPDGSQDAIPVYRGRRSEAFAMARTFTRAERQRRELERQMMANPLVREVLALPAEIRKLLSCALGYVERKEQEGRA